MRGSGVVGLLVHEEVLEWCVVEVLDTEVEDVLWVRLSQEYEEMLTLGVCCIPPESLSCGWRAEETLQLLAEQVEKFGSQRPLIICGDFNVRWLKRPEWLGISITRPLFALAKKVTVVIPTFQ